MTEVEMIASTPDPEMLVCMAARNDYRAEGVIEQNYEEILNANVTEIAQAEEDLLEKLMDRGHWGPFEHPQATIAMEGVTRVSMAQITRHRHFTFDIMSLRYVDVEDESVNDRMQIPETIRGEELVTRDGVSELDEGVEEQYREAYEDSMECYRELLESGVPAEEARKVLPMGTEVNIVMSGNARAWMHLLNIRGKANVQGEARRLADSIMEECKEWMPRTFGKYDEMLPMQLNP
jgi:thymidylate synthase (FAD)